MEHAGVSDDVGGATFMAAGGSAPELFTSLIGTFQERWVRLIKYSLSNISYLFSCMQFRWLRYHCWLCSFQCAFRDWHVRILFEGSTQTYMVAVGTVR